MLAFLWVYENSQSYYIALRNTRESPACSFFRICEHVQEIKMSSEKYNCNKRKQLLITHALLFHPVTDEEVTL